MYFSYFVSINTHFQIMSFSSKSSPICHFLFVNLCLGVFFVHGLDISKAKEGSCISVPALSEDEVTLPWYHHEGTEWEFPFWSKLELYRTLAEVRNEPVSKITEEEIKDSCLAAGNAGDFNVYIAGYEDESALYDLVVTADGSYWKHLLMNGSFAGIDRHANITLTDNHTYVVVVNCWADDQRGWYVLSPQRTVTEESKKKIYDHLASYGFDLSYAYEMPYDHCLRDFPTQVPYVEDDNATTNAS